MHNYNYLLIDQIKVPPTTNETSSSDAGKQSHSEPEDEESSEVC